MPELPEVESYRRLAVASVGRRIDSVSAPDPWFLKGGTTAAGLVDALDGGVVAAVRRHGKLLLVDVDGPAGPSVLGIRFGMTGTLFLDGEAGVDRLLHSPPTPDARWERFALAFSGGGSLVVHDPRRLGGVTLAPDLSALGPDAAAVTAAGLRAALTGSAVPLKARLLDQRRLAGVGNLWADELLWRAGLDPRRPAASLSAPEVRRLHRHLGTSLTDLSARGGSHTGDLMAERLPGGRCPRDGARLQRDTVGGRTTWWCPSHQA